MELTLTLQTYPMAEIITLDNDQLTQCNTKYPVLLVSGLGFHDNHRLMSYWGNIPNYLKEHGCTVFTANQEAFLSIPDNAIKLKFRILDILEKTGAQKINLIGHSKGGLESRYVASRMGMEDAISSITTLGTPHHGTHLADIILGKLPIPKFATARLVNLYALLLGDSRPDSLRAVVQITTDGMKKFNDDVPDMSAIYYQSYVSHVNKEYPNVLWKTLAYIIRPYEGKNDGMVGVESGKWGKYRGIIGEDTQQSVSHGDMVGMTQFFGNPKFDAKTFFVELVKDLKFKRH